MTQQRLLLSLAHPDDESFGYAGTIAHYTQRGVDVHLICATNGDVGTIDDAYMEGFSNIAERRIYELECAAQTLGLTLHTFGYRDSGMQGMEDNKHPDALVQEDTDELVRRVTKVVREIRPQVLVTFDPEGGYGHPDHIAMHHATVQAFEAAGDSTRFPEQLEAGLQPYQPQKLYHSTADMRFMRLAVQVAPLLGVDPTRMGRNKDMDFRQIAFRETGPVHARIRTGPYRKTVERAWACHASQQFFRGGLVQWLLRRRLIGDDLYTRLHPPANGRVNEQDLFEGVVAQD